MILGLNTDVRHRGKTFHIQTEDSGPSNPVLITHLFIGGTIIASHKRRYDELIEGELVDEPAVREQMRAQHKRMYEELMGGAHDEAARRPRQDSRFKDIPLARRARGSATPSPATPSPATPSPAAPSPAAPSPAASGPAALAPVGEPDAEPSEDIALLDSVDLILVDEESGTRRLEFPSELAAGAPFDPLLIAHLLDDI